MGENNDFKDSGTYEDVPLGLTSVHGETGLRLLHTESCGFLTQGFDFPEFQTPHPPALEVSASALPNHFLSKTKTLYGLKLVSSGDLPSTGEPALWLESATLRFYLKAISTAE